MPDVDAPRIDRADHRRGARFARPARLAGLVLWFALAFAPVVALSDGSTASATNAPQPAMVAAPMGATHVAPGGTHLIDAITAARPGDVLILEPGRHFGPLTLTQAITIEGQPGAIVDARGVGSVFEIHGEDITIRGLTIVGSGNDHPAIDSGVRMVKTAKNILIENNRLIGNLYGVDVHGAKDSTVRGNYIEGRDDHRMNDRGNGVYVWNAPGTLIEGNEITKGRDGIFVNTSNKGIFRNNLFYDLRFAVHYMYAHNSDIVGNVSIGNHLGYALMFSDRIKVTDNISLKDRDYGVMLNYANNAEVARNLVQGGANKCTFVYNSHRNLIYDNRYEGCAIGIHFAAGSERNAITGNGFIGNRTQVKYVGTRDVEWSVEGTGNYWSDHPGVDMNGDKRADNRFRPNDLMDHILWSQPAARLLLGTPAVQLVRWSQSAFPATLPGGVVDSFPLMSPPELDLPADVAARAAGMTPEWTMKGYKGVTADSLQDH